MKLTSEWANYKNEVIFNLSVLPENIINMGRWITYPPNTNIVTKGEFPEYLYFIKSGTALGTKSYVDGNEYNYFQIDKNNGNIGLLEVFARKNSYIATIKSITEVIALRVESAIIYNYIMNNLEMLHRCITLVSEDLYKRSDNDGNFYYLDGLNRFRHYLVNYYDMHKDESNRVVVNAEYEDIAKNIGVSIRTVGRSIHQLKQLEEITAINKKIVITEDKYQAILENIFK